MNAATVGMSWVFGLSLLACGGATKPPETAGDTTIPGQRETDQSRCATAGRDDRDVTESSSPNSLASNVRRVYGQFREGEEVRRTLLCREVDTNLDGVKDLFRTYDDQGAKLSEAADSNYDGKIDTWITFAGTRIVRIELDDNGDGEPDETRYYTGGKLSRLQKDTNHDKKPDVFEVYSGGVLQRVGVDANFDGQVDDWYRDELRISEEAKAASQKADGQGKGQPASAPAGG